MTAEQRLFEWLVYSQQADVDSAVVTMLGRRVRSASKQRACAITSEEASPSQTHVRHSRGRARHSLIAAGLWSSLALAAAALAWLPWLWWSGGSAELRIPSSKIRPAGEAAYSAQLWGLVRHSFQGWRPRQEGDPRSFFFHIPFDSDGVPRSTLAVYEDGKPLGPGHASPRAVRHEGHGRFAHLRYMLLFSASDNSDPRSNGRRYTIRRISRPRLEPAQLALAAASWLAAVGLLFTAAFRWRLIVGFLERSRIEDVPALFTLLLIATFSAYAFCFSRLRRLETLQLLFFMAVAGGLFLMKSRRRLLFQRWMFWPAAFLVFTVSSSVLNPSLDSWTAGQRLLLSTFLGVVILSAMYHGLQRPGDPGAILLPAFCMLFALVILLQSLGFDLKWAAASLDGTGRLPWQFGEWNQKYQETWLLMLTWGAVSAIAPRRPQVAALVLSLSGIAVLCGYSYSAKATLLLGIAVYLGSLIAPRTMRHGAAVVAMGSFLAMPLLAGGIWHYFSERPALFEARQGVALHGARRAIVWEYTRELISEQPWSGYGLDATRKLPTGRRPAGEVMAEGSLLPAHHAALPPLRGGHPHSLSLLIWLETGAIGAALGAAFVWAVFRKLGEVRERSRHAAFLALIVSLLFFFGLNYPAWAPALQTLIIMTAGLMASLGSSESAPVGDRP